MVKYVYGKSEQTFSCGFNIQSNTVNIALCVHLMTKKTISFCLLGLTNASEVGFDISFTGTGEWTTPSTSGTPPTPRQGHIVAVVGNKMFVHGGMSGQQIFSDWHVLSLGNF